MLRKISISLRVLQSKKEIKRTLKLYEEWSKEIASISGSKERSKKILIIRLDEIGDYLLFRNTMAAYRDNPEWAGYEITLLGNVFWKEMFEFADSSLADKSYWVNKHEYFSDHQLRKKLWLSLSQEGFEIAICPSHCRPLLLDDLCMLASGAKTRIGCYNDLEYKEINKLSDSHYTSLYKNDKLEHELFYNRGFANWCCHSHLSYTRPSINPPGITQLPEKDYILCFVGASKQSKVWSAERWIELIKISTEHQDFDTIIAGGTTDLEIAGKIIQATNVSSIVGKTTTLEMMDWVANAKGVISNDTMASHLAISTRTPTVIVANGVNFYKFCAYKEAGISGVSAVYPDAFIRSWKKMHYKMFKGHVAVTNDISTIPATTVFAELKNLMQKQI